jgi:hypothetical protein
MSDKMAYLGRALDSRLACKSKFKPTANCICASPFHRTGGPCPFGRSAIQPTKNLTAGATGLSSKSDGTTGKVASLNATINGVT